MKSLPVVSFVTAHADENPVSFHMPGHKGSQLYKKYGHTEFLEKMMDCDITELPGADNLFQTEGILAAAQENYAELYGVKRSYLLVNGTSGGVIAAIMASVPKGRKLIMARNCHKAIYNALLLADIQPVYAYPEMIHAYGISGEITAEEIETCLRENPDADAVILPSPNYYGICSDIRKIAEIVHKYGKVLIVDQAHGAHLKFFDDCGFSDMPKGAESEGADITVNSIHKTLASYTQSALLNLNSDRVDRYVLEDKLQMIQSTSPSYLLMSSLDINCDLLFKHKQELMGEWHEALMYFYREAQNIPGLDIIGNPFGAGEKIRLDITKINLDMSGAGLNAAELEAELIKRHIYAELTTGNILMCMTGIGNTRSDMEKLLAALKEISAAYFGKAGCVKKQVSAVFEAKLTLHPVPKDRERVALLSACGRICASSIIPYPPGIPFICPGEELTQEVIDYIAALRASGEKVIGVTAEGEIFVGK